MRRRISAARGRSIAFRSIDSCGLASASASPDEPEDYQLTVADVKAFEAKNGTIPEGAIVMIATGWDARWPDQKKYMNERAGVKHFPGIHPEAAAYLARDRKVVGIGIDTPSVDYGPSAKFETHNLTMPLNVFHIENAANLTSLPAIRVHDRGRANQARRRQRRSDAGVRLLPLIRG